MESKMCSKCKQVKAITDFSNNRTTIDGKSYDCRVCHNSFNKEWKKRNADKVKEIAYKNRVLGNKNGRLKANAAIHRARVSGEITVKPCAICEDVNSQAHHYLGYSPEHRLDVVWLCGLHHKQYHKYEKGIIRDAVMEERERIAKGMKPAFDDFSKGAEMLRAEGLTRTANEIHENIGYMKGLLLKEKNYE